LGTHFWHFYKNKRDLLDVLIPYFRAGLEQNEFCVWAVVDPLDEREAREEMERAWPGAKERLAAGDIEIVPPSQWAPEDGAPNPQQLARDWAAKFEKALARGYAGMRVNANAASYVEREPRNPAVGSELLSAIRRAGCWVEQEAVAETVLDLHPPPQQATRRQWRLPAWPPERDFSADFVQNLEALNFA